jgi:hypothetical protein
MLHPDLNMEENVILHTICSVLTPLVHMAFIWLETLQSVFRFTTIAFADRSNSISL